MRQSTSVMFPKIEDRPPSQGASGKTLLRQRPQQESLGKLNGTGQSRKSDNSSQMQINPNSSTILPNNITSSQSSTNLKLSKKQQQNILQNLNVKLDQHKSQIEARDEMIEEITLHIEALKVEYIKEKKDVEEQNRIINQLKSANQKWMLKMKTTSVQLQELQNKVISFQRENQQKQDDQTRASNIWMTQEIQYKKREADFEKQIKDLESYLVQQNKQLDKESSASNQVQNLQRLLDAQRKETEQHKLQNNDCMQKITMMQKRIDELKLELQTKASEIENSKKEIQSHKNNGNKESSELKIQISNLNNQISKLKDQVQQEQSKTEKLTQQLIQKNTELNQTLDKFQKEVEDLNNQKKVAQSTLQQQLNDVAKNMGDKDQEIKNLSKNLNDKNNQIEELKQDLERANLGSQNVNEYTESLQLQINKLKSRLEDFSKTSSANSNNTRNQYQKLENAQQEIVKSLKCNYCKEFIQEPITIIPCGHSYCLGCKKAYAKDCIKCGPKIKIEAMYRNQLLDDIIEIVQIVQSLKENLKQSIQ